MNDPKLPNAVKSKTPNIKIGSVKISPEETVSPSEESMEEFEKAVREGVFKPEQASNENE